MAEAQARDVKLHYQRLGREGADMRVVFVHGLVVDNLASWYFSAASAVASFADVLLGNDGFAERMAGTLSLRGQEADLAIEKTFRHWPGRTSARKRGRLVEQARSLVLGTSLVEDMRATQPLDAADFAAIDTPALALYGERSDILAESAPLVASMPRCGIEVLSGCTHSVLWEATDVVRARTVAFCQRLESRGAA